MNLSNNAGNKPPLVILSGPTAVGKTKLSIELAKSINGEIISADSMQVYRGMNIGTAKISEEEKCDIPHHLIDILDPDDDFNVAVFKDLAQNAAKEITARGHIPILTGGTGFYIQALLYDIDFNEDVGTNKEIRERLENEYNENPEAVYQKLIEADVESTKEIHINNKKRVIRALEFYEQTHMPISEHNERMRNKEAYYNFAYMVLNDERNRLYANIDKRVDIMLANGLVEEVQHLYETGYGKDLISMKGLGYKEIIDYLEGASSLEEAVYIIKRDTRHFAKKQITWFKREKEVVWYNKNEYDYDDKLILDSMLRYLSQKNIFKK